MLFQQSPENIKDRINSIPFRYFKKVALGQILVTILFVVAVALFARKELKKNVILDTERNLETIHNFLEKSLAAPKDVCQSEIFKKSDYRITLINQGGTVICDNNEKASEMDHHGNRVEFIEAMKSGHGNSLRYSDTVDKIMVYSARKYFYNGLPSIIRISFPLSGLKEALNNVDRSMVIVFLPLLIVISLLALWGSLKMAFPLRAVMKKLNSLEGLNKKKEMEYHLGSENDWELLESTLESAEKNIQENAEKIFLENQKLSKILESISDSIVAINNDQKILLFNNKFKETFAHQSGNTSQLKLLEVLRNAEALGSFEKTLKEGINQKSYFLPITIDKETLFFDLTVSPLKDSNAKVVGAVGVFHDVNESRKNAKIREDFVTNVGHEIKTPLTALKGYIQILKGLLDNSTEEQNNYFNKIEKNADRLVNLFNDILQLSVIESQTEIKREHLFLEPLTQLVISNVKQTYPNKSIEITSTIEVDEIFAHPIWLEQILTNLVDNAYKYGQQNGEVKIHWSENENGIILNVSDNGMGIAPEHLPRLFERFYRVDTSRSRELGGTGLGLAIVKHIIQKHKGSIEVESKLNEGTSFRVFLPKMAPSKEEA